MCMTSLAFFQTQTYLHLIDRHRATDALDAAIAASRQLPVHVFRDQYAEGVVCDAETAGAARPEFGEVQRGTGRVQVCDQVLAADLGAAAPNQHGGVSVADEGENHRGEDGVGADEKFEKAVE